MRTADLRAEAGTAVRAVRAALGVIARRTDADRVVEKGRFDIATGTDIESQRVIRDVLLAAHPEHGFVGEESDLDGPATARSYWLVDPICGTANFAAGIPLYCANVALVVDGEVVVAAVGDGARGDIWVAERARGAFAVGGDELSPIAVNARATAIVIDPGRPGGVSTDKAATVIAAAIRAASHELRIIGTSLDLALLASGHIGAVWHFSKIAPLHFAAGTLLATEAGAVVADEQGSPWRLDSSSLLAASTPALHASLLRLLSG